MRLLACHIENFGKLSDFTMEFTDGINVVSQPNGWGKSTLAAFLKVMFYGLDAKKDQGSREKERTRYKPWQGGVFGGELDFETDGRMYRIRRTFGRTEKMDEFHLYDLATNLESEDYSKNIGEELFDLDSASFKRSIYIMQNDCAGGTTDNIHAKLGNLAEHTNDINNYESASSRLKDLLNHLSPTRSTGTIKRRVNDMDALEQELQGYDAAEEAYHQISRLQGEKLVEKDGLAQRRQQITGSLQKASQNNLVLEKRKQYEELWSEERQQGENCKKYQNRFPAGVPKEEDIRRATGTVRQMAETEATIRNLTDDENDVETYRKLSELFEEGAPDTEKIENMIAQQKALFSAKEELRHLENEVTVLSHESGSMQEEFLEEEKKGKKKKEKREKKKKKDKKSGGKVSAYKVIAVFFLAVAVAFLVPAPVMALYMGSAGAASMAIGSVCVAFLFLAGAFMFLQLGEDREKERNPKSDGEKLGNQDGELVWVGSGLDADSVEQLQMRIRQEQERVRKMEQEITEFLGKYHKYVGPENVVSMLYELSRDVEMYERLQKKKQSRQEAAEHLDELKGELMVFAESYHLQIGDDFSAAISDIQTKAAEYRIALQEYEKSKWKKEQFEARNDMKQLSGKLEQVESLDELTEEMGELNQRIEELQQDIDQNNRQLDNLELQLEQRDERAQELEDNRLLQEEEFHKYEVMEETRSYLQRAKEQLTARYMQPISDAFEYYYTRLNNSIAQDWQIDANIEIKTNEQGQLREVWQLSSGYQDLIGICMRLALVDAMYKGEKPFLMLDDPFVNLDDEKVKYGREMLRDVAERYQTIYFTCHDSRNPLGQEL